MKAAVRAPRLPPFQRIDDRAALVLGTLSNAE